MIAIVASICLIAEPEKCKDMRLLVESELRYVTPYQCMHMAQAELAKWADSPQGKGWKITRFKCESDDRKKEDA